MQSVKKTPLCSYLLRRQTGKQQYHFKLSQVKLRHGQGQGWPTFRTMFVTYQENPATVSCLPAEPLSQGCCGVNHYCFFTRLLEQHGYHIERLTSPAPLTH